MAATITEQHELRVEGMPTLELRNFAGNVRVAAGAADQVTVIVTKRARAGIFGTASEADLERVRVEVSQQGNTIRVETNKEGWSLIGKNVTVDFDITTPAATTLGLQLNAGNATIDGIAGAIRAKVNAGNLDTRGVTFASGSDLKLNAGNLTLHGALVTSASLDARVNAGNARLFLSRDTNVYLDAQSVAGTVSVSGWRVNTTRDFARQSASGPLGAQPSGTLQVRVDAGNITVAAE